MSKISRFYGLIVLFFVLISLRPAGAVTLENGFWKLTLDKYNAPQGLYCDPSGKGAYGYNLLCSGPSETLKLGPEGVPSREAGTCQVKGDVLVWPELVLLQRRTLINIGSHNVPSQLEPGHTLGQTFTLGFTAHLKVSVFLPTWHKRDSAVTLSLKAGGPQGKVLGRIRLKNLVDNSWVSVESEGFCRPGTYYVELSNPKSAVGWWSSTKELYPAGQALEDGKPVPNVKDRNFKVEATAKSKASCSIVLKGDELELKAKSLEGKGRLRLVMKQPWEQAGYETSDPKRIPFHHFVTDLDLYLPVHQFKRRPLSAITASSDYTGYGNANYDVIFLHAGFTRLKFEPFSAEFLFNNPDVTLKVLHKTTAAPDYFPRFIGSNSRYAALATEFCYSHALNFGVGTPASWKNWCAIALGWTHNYQSKSELEQYLHQYQLGGYVQPDGYINTWGGSVGWPFPFKDEDGDGKNDYDSRHFDTNPSYILGAWRRYCFEQDPVLLKAILPNVELAMKFMLEKCGGAEGLYLANGEGHTGEPDSIPSNYWDILPFGWKSAYSNSLFYASLAALAQLEEAARAQGLKQGYSPDYLRKVAQRAKAAFNRTFWDAKAGRYVGCVDKEGKKHDYGFTFINTQAMNYGLASPEQARRIYDWMEHGITSSGKADTYSRWIFAPRANTFHNPRRSEPQKPLPSWWFWGWKGTDFGDQCQDGGAILYTSYDDVMARVRYLGRENAWQRFTTILDRYALPDHLSGGSLLYLGEKTQGGPGGSSGSVGVEGEFPESGMVPALWLYAFCGVQPSWRGLRIKPQLPRELTWAGVENIKFAGGDLDLRVKQDEVHYTFTPKGGKALTNTVHLARWQACLVKKDGSYELVPAWCDWPDSLR